jgi:hypothetical protein
MNAEVRVSKKATGVQPVAQITVDAKISAAQLAGLIQKVTTDKRVLTAAGLRACGGCKSGLDIHILDRFADPIQFEV